MRSKIDPRREKFARLYVGKTRCNATEAARQAGYRGSDAVLAKQGCNLLKRDDVQRLIAQHSQKAIAKLDKQEQALIATPEEVLQCLTRQMRGTIADFVNLDDPKNPWIDLAKARDLHALGLIRGIKETKHSIPRPDEEPIEVRTFEIKLHDAQGAADKLARALGLYIEKKEEKVTLEVLLPPGEEQRIQQAIQAFEVLEFPFENWPPAFQEFQRRRAKHVENREVG